MQPHQEKIDSSPLYCAECQTELTVITMPDGRSVVKPCPLCCSWHPYPETRPSHPLSQKYTMGVSFLAAIDDGSEKKVVTATAFGDFTADNERIRSWAYIPGSYAQLSQILHEMDEERKFPYGKKMNH